MVVNHVVPVVMNHVVLCWTSRWKSRIERCASGCESYCAMLSRSLWITVCYAKSVVVNHCELCWASGCETLWAMPRYWLASLWGMLSQWLWIIVCYAEPGMWESWCVMLSQWLGITVWMLCQWVWIIVLCWASGCESLCYFVPVGVNDGELCGGSGCESCWVIMCQ